VHADSSAGVGGMRTRDPESSRDETVTRADGLLPCGPEAWAVFVLAAIYLASALLYGAMIHPWYAPDEPMHIAYVRILSDEHRLPTFSETHQAQQSPLYYLLVVPFYKLGSLFGPNGGGHALRVVSALLGLLTLATIWLAARAAFANRRNIALLALGFAALWPAFQYAGGCVNNDALMILIYGLWAWQTALLLRGGLIRRRAVILGLVCAAALLTKETGFVLVFLSLVTCAAILVGALRHRRSLPLAALGWFLLCAAVLPGAWFARNLSVYGQLTPHANPQKMSDYQLVGSLIEYPEWRSAVAATTYSTAKESLRGLWAPFWIARLLQVEGVTPALLVMWMMAPVAAICLVGLVWFLGWRKGDPAENHAFVWLMGACVVLLFLGILRYTILIDPTALRAGRYMANSVPCFALLAAVGFEKVSGPLRRRPIAECLLGLMLFALAVYYLAGARYFYASGLYAL
jgi:4-amino-4-deoxy-L-arabinose transferase-like glycosyltransferase